MCSSFLEMAGVSGRGRGERALQSRRGSERGSETERAAGFGGLRTMRFACLAVLSLFAALSSADARNADGGAPALVVPLLTPAGDVRQGFVRIINHSARAGTVRIHGTDDGGRAHGPVTLFVNAGAAREISARDLEAGDASKGLSGGLGDGEGSWRLRLESDLDIEAGAYIRTPDGFVASVHDIARTAVVGGEIVHRVPIFNPGSNRDQVSWLRLVNPTDAMVDVTIEGRDDEGEPAPGGEVRLTLPAGGARRLSAQQLESGAAGLDGRLGDGDGRWQLFVTASGSIEVASLMQTPAGHLTNLSMSARTVSEADSTTDAAGPAGRPDTNLTASQYQDALTTYTRQGYRPVAVSGYAVGGEARFAAIWSKEAGPAWVARHGLTASQYQDALTTYTRQGYRPVAVSGYAVGGEARFAAIWSKEAGPAWVARHGLTASQYQDALTTYTRQGYRPVAVSGYAVGGEARFAAIWSKEAGPAWAARHGLTASQYQDALTTYTRQGYRPVAVSGYAVGGEARFAAIWGEEAGPARVARHDLTASQYQDALTTYARQGYRPVAVSGYAVGGEARFAAIWSKTGEPVRTIRHTLPLFRAAGQSPQGIARIINRSDRAGTVRIVGTDDAGRVRGPVILDLDPGATRHFDSDDLEEGDASKGLSGSLGDGTGDWRLELTTSLDIEPSAYVRTPDGLLAPMHAVARTVEVGGVTEHLAPIFNSGSNRHETSWLRVANLTGDDVLVTIREREDAGRDEDAAQTTEIREVVLVRLPGRAARRFSARQLESGDHPDLLSGRLVGTGKRRLLVTADRLVTPGDIDIDIDIKVAAPGAIEVMNLVQSPTGHLSNLSTTVHRGFEIVAGGPMTVRPLQTIPLTVPGGLGESDYTVLMDLSGTGEFPEDDTVEVDGLTTDDDRILFASPLTQILPETNTSHPHRLVVRVRREADRATSNVLRYSIDAITSIAGPPGFATMVFETIVKSMYTSVDDTLLNLRAASIQPGIVTWSAARLGVDTAFSDVLAEAAMQSLLGMPVTELASGPLDPPPSAADVASLVSQFGKLNVGQRAADSRGDEDSTSVLTAFPDSRPLGEVSSPLGCEGGLIGLLGQSVCQKTRESMTDEKETRKKIQDKCKDIDPIDHDECYREQKKQLHNLTLRSGQRYLDIVGDVTIEVGSNLVTGIAINKGMGATKGMLLQFVTKGKGGTATRKSVQAMSDANRIMDIMEKGAEMYRVGVGRKGKSDSGRDFDESGKPTKKGLQRNFESHKDNQHSLKQYLDDVLPEAEKDFGSRPNTDNGARESFSVVVNDTDRRRREAEGIEDREGVYTGEKSPREAIGHDPSGGMAVAESCDFGYEEFPIDDETSTCVFESLVEPECYAGSRQPGEVDLGGSEVCLYYSLDWFIEDFLPEERCRENYERVYFQERWTCRWADLGPNQPHWYTLHKAQDDEQPKEPEQPAGHKGLSCVEFGPIERVVCEDEEEGWFEEEGWWNHRIYFTSQCDRPVVVHGRSTQFDFPFLMKGKLDPGATSWADLSFCTTLPFSHDSAPTLRSCVHYDGENICDDF